MGTDHDRFMRYVQKTADCWLWTGAKIPRGYGRFFFRGKPRYAHRVALELLKGTPPDDAALVMHWCDNPSCVNPDHLSIGTQALNMRDAALKGRTRNLTDWTGVRNPKAKLSMQQRADLEARLSAPYRPTALALEFGISRIRVQQIAREANVTAKAKKDGGGWNVEEF